LLEEKYSKIKPYLPSEAYSEGTPPCILYYLIARPFLSEDEQLKVVQLLAEYFIFFKKYSLEETKEVLKNWDSSLNVEEVLKKALSLSSSFYCENPLLKKVCKKTECKLPTWIQRNFFFGEIELKKRKVIEEAYGKVKYKAVYELDGNTIIYKARGVTSYWTYPSRKEAEEVFYSLKKKTKLKFYISPEEVKKWLRKKP